jgi:polynucleotide 5'-kinase involved in rRNA processing
LTEGRAHKLGERTSVSATLSHDEAFTRLLENPGVALLLGGVDSGKTTFGIELATRAVRAGIKTAIVDADTVLSTVGPPTTVGLRLIASEADLTRERLRRADALGFVGSIVPKGHLLPLTTSTAKLVGRARTEGADLVVVDTTSLISGIYGQTLKFFKMELLDPDVIVGFERGGELDPVAGIARRFTPAEVLEIPVDASVVPRSAEERVTFREEQFAAYFADHGGASVPRWRIRPTVFMPTLPPEFDLGLLDGLVVGAEDGKGNCLGIGVLEYDQGEDILRMASPVTEGVRGLRLGSLRIDIDGRSRGPVDLRHLFGTD